MLSLSKFQKHYKHYYYNKLNIIQFSYTLDKFQLDAIESIHKKEHILALAHTGAGKTTIAEYAIAKCIHMNKKVIYTSPIKTLSNQKYYDLKSQFNDIGISTGDVKINAENSQCLIMTTEILRNKLFSDMSFFDEVEIVIFDEVHYIKDIERGHVWEESIIMLPKHITIVMLSATISNSDFFAKWVENIKGIKTNLSFTDVRPVPLHFYLYTEDKLWELVSNHKINYIHFDSVIKTYNKFFKDGYSYKSLFNNLCDYLSLNEMMPAILFTFSRKNCEVYSEYITYNLIDHNQRREIENIFDKYTKKNMSIEEQNLNQTILIKKNLLKGIGIHHSGLMPLLKEIIELLFSKGLIRLLFATETFAVGVNMPAKTVIFTELQKYDNYYGKRNLFTDEFRQMCGRAGRRGKDIKGNVIYMPIKNVIAKNEIASLILGDSPKILSKFILDTKLILKSIESNSQNTLDIIQKSLLYYETNVNIQSNYNDIIELKKQIILFTPEENNIVQEYLNISHSKKKKLHQLKEKYKQDIDSIIVLYNENEKIKYKLKELQQNNEYLKKSASYRLFSLLNYLIDIEFIKLDLNKYNYNQDNAQYLIRILNKDCLTKKGIIACQINECNNLLMSILIDNNMFKDYTDIEFISIMSIFLEEKEEAYLDDIIIPKIIKDKIHIIVEEHKKVNIIAEKYNVRYIFEPNYSFLEYAYEWSIGKNIKEVMTNKKNNIYEGNFIRNMLKINNMIDEIIQCWNVNNQYDLILKMNTCKSLIIRDIISIHSIYLN